MNHGWRWRQTAAATEILRSLAGDHNLLSLFDSRYRGNRYLARATWRRLLLEVGPGSKREQQNRNDPERRIVHSCFLGHEAILSQDRRCMGKRWRGNFDRQQGGWAASVTRNSQISFFRLIDSNSDWLHGRFGRGDSISHCLIEERKRFRKQVRTKKVRTSGRLGFVALTSKTLWSESFLRIGVGYVIFCGVDDWRMDYGVGHVWLPGS
jgi:hypothetical protein